MGEEAGKGGPQAPQRLERSRLQVLRPHQLLQVQEQVGVGVVANARVAFFALADVSDRIRPSVVSSTKGRWPGGSQAGATINATVDDRDADLGGGAVYHGNRVRVDKVS